MKKIGFIGAGNMATAIIKGLMAQNDGKADFINVFDVSEEKCAAMKNMGVSCDDAELIGVKNIRQAFEAVGQ